MFVKARGGEKRKKRDLSFVCPLRKRPRKSRASPGEKISQPKHLSNYRRAGGRGGTGQVVG